MERSPLGKRVRTARKQLGITCEKLAEACYMDSTYLRQIESGSKMPSLQMFIILCRELKVSPAVLLADYLPPPEHEEWDALHDLLRTLNPEQKDLLRRLLTVVGQSLES